MTKDKKDNRDVAAEFNGEEPKKHDHAQKTEKPQATFEYPTPSLGGGGAKVPRGPLGPKTSVPTYSPQAIDDHFLDKATDLKTRQASQRQELENQNKQAWETKLEEMDKKFDAAQRQFEQTRDEIQQRQGRGGFLSGVMYMASGQYRADKDLAKENERTFVQAREDRTEELSSFQTSLDEKLTRFDKRCASESEALVKQRDEAHKKGLIPEHDQERGIGRDRSDDDGGHTL